MFSSFGGTKSVLEGSKSSFPHSPALFESSHSSHKQLSRSMLLPKDQSSTVNNLSKKVSSTYNHIKNTIRPPFMRRDSFSQKHSNHSDTLVSNSRHRNGNNYKRVKYPKTVPKSSLTMMDSSRDNDELATRKIFNRSDQSLRCLENKNEYDTGDNLDWRSLCNSIETDTDELFNYINCDPCGARDFSANRYTSVNPNNNLGYSTLLNSGPRDHHLPVENDYTTTVMIREDGLENFGTALQQSYTSGDQINGEFTAISTESIEQIIEQIFNIPSQSFSTSGDSRNTGQVSSIYFEMTIDILDVNDECESFSGLNRFGEF